MTDPIGPVHWGAFDGNHLEATMAVLLLQERPRAWRRTPSSGDGGVDVVDPIDDGYHVYQIKGFTGRLGTSERRQIKKSFTAVCADPRLDKPVRSWTLVVPTDLTSGEEDWFRTLTKDASFDCDWKGKIFWYSEAAKHPHIIDYYLGNGRAKLERSVRELFSLLGDPGTPVLPAEVVGRISSLRSAVNRSDPHYRYEFSTSDTPPAVSREDGLVLGQTSPLAGGGFLTIRVFARYSQAPEDRPIRGRLSVAVPTDVHPDVAEDLQAFFEFGRGVELPDGTVTDFSIDAPGGLGTDHASGGGRIGPAEIQEFRPQQDRFQVLDPTGAVLADALVDLEQATSGTTGIELRGSHVGGGFTIIIQIERPQAGTRSASTHWTVRAGNHVGRRAVDILSGVQLLGHLTAPNELVWRPEFGPTPRARQRLEDPTPGAPLGYVRLTEALAVIQHHTSIPVLMPEAISDDEAAELQTAVRLLQGETVTGTWGPDGSMVVNADAVDEIAALMRGSGVFAIESELTVHIGGVEIALGRSYQTLEGLELARVEPIDDASTVLHIVASGDARYAMRYGPLPEAAHASRSGGTSVE